ncbi:hypothetical protein N7448_002095 [Penicillium atrosanguineum]|uniref:Uncharacterized protein n=1 Tax=Penicillium atrosanguineum TaxID=1132637 RepID=A0A9W9HDE8_9EURO|nr:uncharacterized protein N7443_005498 [Penicillium atrosanguineum]KAJ5128377.1 hypothetical protein N7526_006543 [Penicillium atrosanguineum]KAJ5144703.1 hypothetical protein N7448_002095 [Penicillium atrosanguineum]KAJ5300496.1 hypothetical protein N7443_005498 [Penicillium atrosanguineum]KAJ5311139.1 hypothetical protein N7476_006999 [Penicillium atrosanguineum]
MAQPASLDKFLRPLTTFVSDSLEAAPFQTFLVLVLIYMLSLPVIGWIMTLWPLFPSDEDSPHKVCPTCGSVGGTANDETQNKISKPEVN